MSRPSSDLSHPAAATTGRVAWYLQRLRAMGPREVLYHVRGAAIGRLDDFAWRAAPSAWRRSWEPSSDRLFTSMPPSGPIGLLREDKVAVVHNAVPEAVEDVVAAARRWVTGAVDVLGYEGVHVARAGPLLDHDPLTGGAWPSRHGARLGYRHEPPGDPKLIWELNRCQALPLLVLASRLSGDGSLADVAADRLLAWVDGHPPGRGIAWANAFEPGVRALSLAVAFDGLRAHPLLAGAPSRRIARALWQHGRWIFGRLSSYSSANNHLLGELVGVLAVAVLVPELRDAGRWRALAGGRLAQEAELQIADDGSGVEQSFAYTLFAVDLLLTAVSLLESDGDAEARSITGRLTRAADALTLLVGPGEPDPAFGDDDSGRVLLLDGEAMRTSRGVAAALGACLGHGGACRLAGQMDATAALLFGSQGHERFARASASGTAEDGFLPDAGLVVMRRADSRALFDSGPLGYLSIAAHGHADALQVDLSVGGQEIIVDPGTGSYVDPIVRSTLRGTRAHATVTVDGFDQSHSGGPFLWTRHAEARFLVVDLARGVVIAEHAGYSVLDPPARHRRTVIALDGAFIVLDRLDCDGQRRYELNWPLAPGVEPRGSNGRVLLDYEGATRLVVHATASDGIDLRLADGLYSRRLESWTTVRVVRGEVVANGAVELGTLLVPVTAGSAPETTCGLRSVGSSTIVDVGVGSGRWTFEVSLGGEHPVVSRI